MKYIEILFCFSKTIFYISVKEKKINQFFPNGLRFIVLSIKKNTYISQEVHYKKLRSRFKLVVIYLLSLSHLLWLQNFPSSSIYLSLIESVFVNDLHVKSPKDYCLKLSRSHTVSIISFLQMDWNSQWLSS